jgi:hypothetical protein
MDDNARSHTKNARQKKSSGGKDSKKLESNSWSNSTKSFQFGIVARFACLKEPATGRIWFVGTDLGSHKGRHLSGLISCDLDVNHGGGEAAGSHAVLFRQP